jgi:lipid-A-disaccharide synthase
LSVRLLLSCGEASGDLYAGALTRELRSLDPSVTIEGLGGPQFEAAGGRLIDDYRDIAVTGLTEAIAKVPRSFGALRRIVNAARHARPHALIVIDAPDFNFRLAPQIKKLGVPVVYYIGPQIWAWRPARLNTIRSFADRMLVIFPFEEVIYREGGVPVEFVGHPLVDLMAPNATREQFLSKHGLPADRPTIAVLPGSRGNEVARILPDLMSSAERIRASIPEAQFLVARAPHLEDRLFMAAIRAAGRYVVVEGETNTVLAASDVVLTASGTATVQTALHDKPMVIVYRLSPLTYRLGRRLVTVDTIGMVNLIAGEKIVPELVQNAFTPEAVAREAISMLTDRERASRIREGLARVRERLGGPGASRRAAEAVFRVVRARANITR